jgi:hypothetical protein
LDEHEKSHPPAGSRPLSSAQASRRRRRKDACFEERDSAGRDRCSSTEAVLHDRPVDGSLTVGFGQIVVSFTDHGQPRSEAYDIWRSDPPGDISDPRDVDMTAHLIFMNVSGM